MRIAPTLVVLLSIAVSGCTTASYGGNDAIAGTGATAGGDKKVGAKIFASNCATCHGPEGAGGGVGPSLRGESQRMNYETAASWIEDPEPPMPLLYPRPLDDQQVRDVSAYVQTL